MPMVIDFDKKLPTFLWRVDLRTEFSWAVFIIHFSIQGPYNNRN